MFERVLIGILGLFCGLMVSGGVFTALLALGLVPRFAGKTHTANKVLLYEEMVIAGTIIGGLVSLFPEYSRFGYQLLKLGVSADVIQMAAAIFLALFGVFAGMFIGCLALAIAEMLDSIPIFTRRISFRHGLGCMVLSIALGKLCGALIYFWYDFSV